MINFSIIFEKSLLILTEGMEEENKEYIKALSLEQWVWEKTEDIQEKVGQIEMLNYAVVSSRLYHKSGEIKKRFEKRLRKEYRAVQRRRNFILKSYAKKTLNVIKRVTPVSVKNKIKEMMGK